MKAGPLVRRPITTAVLYAVVGSFPLFLAGAYAVRLQEDLGATRSQFGYAAAAYFATAALATPPLSRLVDRHGARVGGIVAALGGSLAAAIVGTATTNWIVLGLALGITGVANAAGQLGGNRILASRVSSERQGVGFGAKQAAVPFGSFIAGATVSVLGLSVPWNVTFSGYVVVGVAVALLAPDLEVRGSGDGQGRGVGPVERPVLLALAAAGGVVGATGNALVVLVVDAFESSGFSPSVAAGVLAFGSGAAVAGRLAIGWFIDRRRTDGYPELTAVIVTGAVGFAALTVAGGNRVLLLVGVALGFAAGYGWPAIIYYVTVRNSTAPPATATGFVLTGVFLGAIAGPAVFATLADRFGYQTAWGAAAMATLLAAGAVQLSYRLARARA